MADPKTIAQKDVELAKKSLNSTIEFCKKYGKSMDDYSIKQKKMNLTHLLSKLSKFK